MRSNKGDELRTPNPLCPSCKRGTLHTANHWKKYHPLSRTGHIEDTAPIKTTKLK